VEFARRVADLHGGRVIGHRRFGTAKWIREEPGTEAVDFVTARREFYAAPSALPGVERGSLASDLRRRDFTVNTIAIDLGARGGRQGRVIDMFGGVRDLRRGRIRVLHSLSFVEDPTRILRAERFAARLGFAIEERTSELSTEAVGLLRRVSGARIRNELLAVFAEPSPDSVLAALEARGALGAIEPPMMRTAGFDRLQGALPALWDRWHRLRPDLLPEPGPNAADLLVLWLARQPRPRASAARLDLPRRLRLAVETLAAFRRGATAAASADISPSELRRALRGSTGRVLVLGWADAVDPLRANLAAYLGDISLRKPILSGSDILALGVAPGPEVGRILRAIEEAVVDGGCPDRDAELGLARALIERAEAAS
jgi:tRNA nucleotidyltransferase (CCA-adding enzyme)